MSNTLALIGAKARSVTDAAGGIVTFILFLGMMFWLGAMGFLLGYISGQNNVYASCAQTARWDPGGVRGMYCRVDE